MNDKITKYALVCNQVLELFRVLQEEGQFKIKRAEMRSGETAALPVDFVADVQIKAKRALAGDPYALGEWANVLRDPAYYRYVSPATRENLGKAFHEGDLGVNGAYRSLYARQGKDNE